MNCITSVPMIHNAIKVTQTTGQSQSSQTVCFSLTECKCLQNVWQVVVVGGKHETAASEWKRIAHRFKIQPFLLFVLKDKSGMSEESEWLLCCMLKARGEFTERELRINSLVFICLQRNVWWNPKKWKFAFYCLCARVSCGFLCGTKGVIRLNNSALRIFCNKMPCNKKDLSHL